MKVFIFIISTSLLFLFSSCHDLDIEYDNFPDLEKALSNPDDVLNIAKGGFYGLYMANTSSISPRMAMWTMADQGTCSWANSGMLDLSSEPRRPFDNDVTYTYSGTFEAYYADLYSTLSQMNDVLKVLDKGMEIGELDRDSVGENTAMVRSFSHFIQGASLGYLALTYDQAFIVTEHTDVLSVELSPYQEVMDSALVCLQKAADIAEANSFTIPDSWINGFEYSNDELEQLSYSYMARFLVQLSRTKAQNELVDWALVLDYAEKGIEKSLLVHMDDINWTNWFYNYTIQPGWALIDCRILNLLDKNYPERYPEDGTSPGAIRSDDSRSETDFNYISVINMRPERGYYHFSNYEYKRYDYHYETGVTEADLPDFWVAENDLLKAEALVHLERSAEAVSILNAGTRNTRGNLGNLSEDSSDSVVLEAIFYERDIELIHSGFGMAFFDMRRRDMLQIGTLLHFPIPAQELMLQEKDIYTYGGVANADGINTSNGGWYENDYTE